MTKLKDDEKIYPNLYPDSNKIVYEYDFFVSRYNSAIRKYRKAIGSKATPEQNRAAQGYRILIVSIISFLFLIFFIILAFLGKKYGNSQTLEKFFLTIASFFLFLCFALFVGVVYEGIRYRIRTSTMIRRGIFYMKVKLLKLKSVK